MSGTGVLDELVSLGGLTGLGALITSTAGLIETRRRLRPNHGSSVADGVRRIEDAVKSLGHQIGEVKSDLADERRDRRAWDESLSDRLQALEARRR